MTLVVAGFDLDGKVFFIADSAISGINSKNGSMSRFKKIYELPITVYQPYFTGNFSYYYPFRDYNHSIVFAMSGSTLIAQDIMNCIINHLRRVRVDIDEKSCNHNKLEYFLTTHNNSRIILAEGKYEYSRDIHSLSYDEIIRLANKDNLKNIIESAIEMNIKDLYSYFSYEQLNKNKYLFSLYCNETKANYLYKININITDNKKIDDIKIVIEEIPQGSLGIIGIPAYDDELKDFYDQLFSGNSKKIPEEMLGKFHEIVTTYNNKGSNFNKILHPIFCEKFDQGKIIESLVKQKDNPITQISHKNALYYYRG